LTVLNQIKRASAELMTSIKMDRDIHSGTPIVLSYGFANPDREGFN